MSTYRHDLKKFADAGLQLRLPVDLVPAMQYSRLTNILPVIEGELRARDGVTFIADVFKTAYVTQLGRANLGVTDITSFYTEFITGSGTAGFVIGQDVLLTIKANVIDSTTTFPLGTFLVTLTGVATPNPRTGYTFTPAIAGATWGAVAAAPVYAQAVGQAQITTLANTRITNLFRLSQAAPSFTGDRIAVMAGRVFRAPLPAGDTFIELVRDQAANTPAVVGNGLSGAPVSIVGFRFTEDTASWAIIADRNIMLRYRENPDGPNAQTYFFQLGKPAPPSPASAADGGTGLLNSTGGTGFDWRYTWHDSIVNTEGNPSPITTGPPDTQQPKAFTTPDPSVHTQGPPHRILSQAVSAPGNAIDGSGTSFTSAVGSISSSRNDFPPFDETSQTIIQSCIYRNTSNPASPPSADVFLNIVYDAALSGGSGLASAVIDYSLDAGATYKSIVNSTGNTSQTTIVTKLDTGVDYTNLRVRIKAQGLSAVPDSDAIVMTLRVFDISIITSATSGALALVNKKAVVSVSSPNFGGGGTQVNDGRITGIRLYRRGGSLTDAWRLVGTFALSGLTIDPITGQFLITDNVPDATLEVKPIMQLDNDMPVTSVSASTQPLTYIWGPVGLEARLLGCGDPSRPECVYFSKPGNPDAWPPQNFVEVCEPGTPVVAGCVFNTRTYAFSREGCYELVEGLGTGTTFAPFKTPSAHGLYAAQALATGPAIYFVAKDGVYQTTGGQEESLVENNLKPLFATYDGPGQDIEGYEAVDMTRPDDMRLRYHNDELYFCYIGATTGTRQMMVYDILKKRWRAVAYTNGMSEVYSEPATVSSLLFGTAGGAIYQAGGNSDPSELDALETVQVITQLTKTLPVSLPAGNYFVYVTRLSTAGEVAISHEFPNIAVNNTQPFTSAIRVLLPASPPANTTGWRVYYGLTSGQEAQYQEFPATPPGNTVLITTTGTAGILPTDSPDYLIHCVLRTGAHDQGAPLNQKQYGNVIFDLDPGGADAAHPVTITPYVNGEIQTKASQVVTGTGRQQVPLNLSDYFAFNTEYEVSWSRAPVAGSFVSDPTLFQYDTLTFMEPVAVTHWESQPTSFEFPGFVHCRDAYIAIRSTADATLKMTFDTGQGEVMQTYTVPSTGGLRAKVYIQFAANKGLAYRFALDSAAAMRLYEQDIEFRVKPWLGLLGYAVQRVMGGEVNA